MAIQDNLDKIKSAVYGEEVRTAIHDAIHDCYEDGKAGSMDLVAREAIAQEKAARIAAITTVDGRITTLASLTDGSTTGDAELMDIRTPVDGVTEFNSAGDAVRGQIDGLVKVQNTQPDDTLHRFWVQPASTQYVVAEYEDLIALGITDSDGGIIAKIDGTISAPVAGLIAYGKSTQSGVAALDAAAPITCVAAGGTLRVCTARRNLLVGMKRTYSTNGCEFAEADGGGVHCTGTPISNNAFSDGSANLTRFTASGYPMLPAGTYTIPAPSAEGIAFTAAAYAPDGTSLGISVTASTSAATLTLTQMSWVYFRVRINSGASNVDAVVYPAIYKSDDAPETFEAFAGSTADVPVVNGLNAVPVTSGGNYTDASNQQWLCDTIDFATRKITRRVNRVVLLGAESESYSKGTSGDDWRFGYLLGDKKPPTMTTGTNTNLTQLSSHFTFLRNAGSVYTTVGSFIAHSNGTLYFRPAATITTVTELKTWLADQNSAGTPVTFIYPLATPVVEDLTEEQITELLRLHSAEDVTRVWCADEAMPEINATVLISTKYYIDNAIAAALASRGIGSETRSVDISPNTRASINVSNLPTPETEESTTESEETEGDEMR